MALFRRTRRTNEDPWAPSGSGAAAYRELADNFLSLRARRPLQTVAVASALPGEGASTVAIGLAHALAASGADETLLVDCNLRTPTLAGRLGVSEGPGVVEAVAGAVEDPRELVVPTDTASLSLLRAGVERSDPNRVLAADGFKTLLEDVSRGRGSVILDTAPISVGRDAGLVSTLVDGVILVIEAERANHEVIARARRRLEDVGGEIVGTVLNRRRYPIPGAIYRRL